MSVKKILAHNDRGFLSDLHRVSEVMTNPINSGIYLTVLKKQVKKQAEECTITYYLTNKIFKVGREVMVII